MTPKQQKPSREAKNLLSKLEALPKKMDINDHSDDWPKQDIQTFNYCLSQVRDGIRRLFGE